MNFLYLASAVFFLDINRSNRVFSFETFNRILFYYSLWFILLFKWLLMLFILNRSVFPLLFGQQFSYLLCLFICSQFHLGKVLTIQVSDML